MNQKKLNSIDVDDMIARLETIELSEVLRNDKFYNETLPILKNTNIMDYFGRLSKDDQDRMQQDAMSSQDLNNPTKWTQMLFGSILSNRVRLTTFIDANKADTNQPTQNVQAQESFFTNYKLITSLCEEEVQVGLGTFRDELFLKDPLEIRAYVRTAIRHLFISSTESGQYKDFIHATSFPKSVEGKKLKEFASQITEQVKTAAIADVTKAFTSPEEKQIIQSLLSQQGIYTVLLDAINLALVDLLNQGTFSTNYGNTFKAAQSLLANNLVSEMPAGYKTLKQSHPEVAVDITQKLTLTTKRLNPYLIDKSKMLAAFTRARNVKSPHTSSINGCLATFSNLVSSLGNTLGTVFDFDEYAVLPQDRKAEYFLSLFPNQIYLGDVIKTDHLSNAFICIESKRLAAGQSGGVAIAQKVAVGTKFSKVANKDSLSVINPQTKLPKAAVISDRANQYIINDALKNYGVLTKDTYTTVIDQLDTTSTAGTNTGEGNTKSPKAQFLNIVNHLFDPKTKQLETDTILLAIVPKLLLQGALLQIKTSDEPLYNRYPDGYYLDKHLSGGDTTVRELLNNFRSMHDMYFEYINLMLEPSTPKQNIHALREKFRNIVQNLYAGIWSHSSVTGFGVVPGINVDSLRGEVSLNEEIENPVNMQAMKEFVKKRRDAARNT